MPFQIIRDDLTRVRCDAIVAPAGPGLRGDGGLEAAIHRAAGPGLAEECRRLGGCAVGEAKATGAYALPCRWVIHTVGPVWRGGLFGERQKLRACYQNALGLALKLGCESVAFPLISAGTYGYPRDKALEAAVETVRAFLREHELSVFLVLYEGETLELGRRFEREIREFIDDRYVEAHPPRRNDDARRRGSISQLLDAIPVDSGAPEDTAHYSRETMTHRPPEQEEPFAEEETPAAPAPREDAAPNAAAPRAEAPAPRDAVTAPEDLPFYGAAAPAPSVYAAPLPVSAKKSAAAPPKKRAAFRKEAEQDAVFADDIARRLRELDESFQQKLLRLIDESGMTDAECYKKANVDRKLFSKIRKDPGYRPSKVTAVAFAVALELDLAQTGELLRAAGFALSHSSKFDVIVEYFILHHNYDIFEINEALFAFDQVLLGA